MIKLDKHLNQIIHAVENLRTTSPERDKVIDGIIEEIRSYFPLIGNEDPIIYAGIDSLSPEIDKLASDESYQGDSLRFGRRSTLPAPPPSS